MPEYFCGRRTFRPACKTAFLLRKTDAQTGCPLAGAVFELRRGPCALLSCKSGTNGCVFFPCTEPGEYTLQETVAPPCYLRTETPLSVSIREDGKILIEGKETCQVNISNHRADRAAAE